MHNRLPDTPWHVGYAKKEEDDPRRHKARCIHNKGGFCTSTRSNYCKEKCGGSSHCLEYSESIDDYEKSLESRKTIEELAQDNRDKYREIVKAKKRAFINESNRHVSKNTDMLHRCLLCDEGLKQIKYSLKKCKFCGMYYVNQQDMRISEVISQIGSDEVFVMNIRRDEVTKVVEKKYQIICICRYADKRGKCMCSKSSFYTNKCKKRQCEYYRER